MKKLVKMILANLTMSIIATIAFLLIVLSVGLIAYVISNLVDSIILSCLICVLSISAICGIGSGIIQWWKENEHDGE